MRIYQRRSKKKKIPVAHPKKNKAGYNEIFKKRQINNKQQNMRRKTWKKAVEDQSKRKRSDVKTTIKKANTDIKTQNHPEISKKNKIKRETTPT